MNDRAARIHEITRHLRVLFRTIQAHAKQIRTTCGLSGAKLWMLHEIDKDPGLKVSDLAEALTIHPSTCSNMLDKLEEQELISRKRCSKDQRTVQLYVTEAGKQLLDLAPRPAQGELSRALQTLPDQHLIELERSLGGLIQALDTTDEDAALLPIPGD